MRLMESHSADTKGRGAPFNNNSSTGTRIVYVRRVTGMYRICVHRIPMWRCVGSNPDQGLSTVNGGSRPIGPRRWGGGRPHSAQATLLAALALQQRNGRLRLGSAYGSDILMAG